MDYPGITLLIGHLDLVFLYVYGWLYVPLEAHYFLCFSFIVTISFIDILKLISYSEWFVSQSHVEVVFTR